MHLVTSAHKPQHGQAYAAGFMLTGLGADVTERVLFLTCCMQATRCRCI
jgi:hypothetical protein